MVKRAAKMVRKEGNFHLYRCTVCLEVFGENPTPEEIKSVSYTNVKRHHESMHSDVEFVQVRGDLYYQPPEGDPVMIKRNRPEPFLPCKTWPRDEAGLQMPRDPPHEAGPQVPQEPPLDELRDALLELGDLFFDLGEPPKQWQHETLPYKVWPYEPHQLPFPPAPFYVEPNPDPI